MSELPHRLEEALGICCGETEIMWKHIHETLKIINLRRNPGTDDDWKRSGELLDEHLQLGKTDDTAMYTVYLHFLDKLDLIEHGSGIGGSWLTTHGEHVLKALDDYVAEKESHS